MNNSIKGKISSKRPKEINRIISSFLIFCYLIQLPLINLGCYSYYSLKGSQNNPQKIKSHNSIKFILNDKSEVGVSSKNCYFFERDTALIYGIGLLYKGKDLKSSNFNGFINKGDIDSVTYSEKTHHPRWLYWLKDDKMLIFDKSNVVDLSKSNESKQWLVLNADHTAFRIIPINDVNDIQAGKSTWVFPVIIVIGIIILMILLGHSSFMEGWNNSNWHL